MSAGKQLLSRAPRSLYPAPASWTQLLLLPGLHKPNRRNPDSVSFLVHPENSTSQLWSIASPRNFREPASELSILDDGGEMTELHLSVSLPSAPACVSPCLCCQGCPVVSTSYHCPWSCLGAVALPVAWNSTTFILWMSLWISTKLSLSTGCKMKFNKENDS